MEVPFRLLITVNSEKRLKFDRYNPIFLSTMDLKRSLVISILYLSLMYFCACLNGKVGLCEFEEMFPSQGREMCFREDAVSDDEISSCPLNMVWGNCTCMATCGAPKANNSCYNRSCSGSEGCYCPNGFLMEGGNCIPLNKCECFLPEEGEVLPINKSFVSSDCSRRCVCQPDGLVCLDDYTCSPNALCDIRNNVRSCYCNDGFIGDGQTCSPVEPIDCYNLFIAGFSTSGVYTIQPINVNGILPSFDVYCNMEDGGGWTVIQRRIDGDVDFYLGWEDYKHGFGSLQHEFWLGNDKIAILTNQKDYQLRIDFLSSVGTPYYAVYTLFRVGSKDDNYTLESVGQYSGNTGRDSLSYHVGHMFSTYDRDNDDSHYNCAVRYQGAWWYNGCYQSNLNGEYFGVSFYGIYWTGLSQENQIAYVEMKIRPTET